MRHSFLKLNNGKLTDEMLSDLHNIMVTHVTDPQPTDGPTSTPHFRVF